jgi:hypothetical protein
MDTLAVAGEIVRELSAAITAHLSSQLDECQSVVSDCHGNICGLADLLMDECQRTVERCHRRIDDALVFKLATVYNLLAPFGVAYPTDEQLQSQLGASMGDGALSGVPATPQTAQNPPVTPPGPSPGIAEPAGPERMMRPEPAALLPQAPATGLCELLQPRQAVRPAVAGDCIQVMLCEQPAPEKQFADRPAPSPKFLLFPIVEDATGEVNA